MQNSKIKFYSHSHRILTKDTETYPGHKQNLNFHGLKVLKSYSQFSYNCGIMLEINIKRYLKIIHIFSSANWHLPREIFDLAIENLNKAKRLKNTEADSWEDLNEKLISKTLKKKAHVFGNEMSTFKW